MRRCLRAGFAFVVLGVGGLKGQAQQQVGALTTHQDDIWMPITGFGLVIGLEGTGDRDIGGFGNGGNVSARAISNLLRSFGVNIDGEQFRARNVAAVLVEADVSPYMRAGSRFDVRVSSIHDATSLRGGNLVTTPLQLDPNGAPIGFVRGAVLVREDTGGRLVGRGGTSGTIPAGGVLEMDLPRVAAVAAPTLNLNRPNSLTATSIAAAINTAHGNGTAAVLDPGTIQLNLPQPYADNLIGFYAAIDTLSVGTDNLPRIIISQHDGSVATVGDISIGRATVSLRGITLSVGADAQGQNVPGQVFAPVGATVHDIAAGLHAAGARPEEISSIFGLLRQAGALSAEIQVQ